MDLVHLLVVVGVAVIVLLVIWWLVNQFPMEPMIRKVITIAAVVIVAILAIIILLQVGGMSSVKIG